HSQDTPAFSFQHDVLLDRGNARLKLEHLTKVAWCDARAVATKYVKVPVSLKKLRIIRVHYSGLELLAGWMASAHEQYRPRDGHVPKDAVGVRVLEAVGPNKDGLP